jgi:hypothetical protein
MLDSQDPAEWLAHKLQRMEERRPSEERRGGCIGVPGLIAVLVFWAFAGTVGGLKGFLIAVAVIPLMYLIIGAVVWMGKRRSDS